jgi:hypothetical protein
MRERQGRWAVAGSRGRSTPGERSDAIEERVEPAHTIRHDPDRASQRTFTDRRARGCGSTARVVLEKLLG